MATLKTSTYRKQANQPLRVYKSSQDTTGIVMCPAHRDGYFARVPSAVGHGEFGGTCELCDK